MEKRRFRAVERLVAVGLALAVCVTPSLSLAETDSVTFTDLEQSYAKQAVDRLTSLHLINGQGGGQFHPQDPVTRQDFSVLLSKVTGLQPIEREDASFADVPVDSAYAPYVYALMDTGIIRGRANGTLGASESLTRQELAVLLQRFMSVSGTEQLDTEQQPTSYTDEAKIAPYAAKAVQAVTAKRWMLGSSGKFYPLGLVTRGDAAVIAERILLERIQQAKQVPFTVSVDKLTLLAGTSQRIEVKEKNGKTLPFSPVFAFDRPEIGTILAEGTFIAGPNQGTGQITVSVGYQTLTVPVEITSDGAPAEEADKESQVQAATDESGKNPEGLVNYASDSFYSVKTTGPADSYFHELEMKYPGPVGGLITSSETWTGYSRQFGREVTIALPKTKQLKRVMLSFKQDKKQGILMPTDMEVELSKDGKAWFSAGKAGHLVSATDETPLVRSLAVSLPSIEARYVRARFPVKIFVFARQLQVLGEDEQEASAAPVWLAPVTKKGALEDNKVDDRMKNLLLAYSGAHEERGMWTKKDFVPLVGYMSPDGKMLDQMFDSILFLPYPNLG